MVILEQLFAPANIMFTGAVEPLFVVGTNGVVENLL